MIISYLIQVGSWPPSRWRNQTIDYILRACNYGQKHISFSNYIWIKMKSLSSQAIFNLEITSKFTIYE